MMHKTRNGMPKTVKRNYDFIGLRPVGDSHRRLRRVKEKAAQAGLRCSVSGLVNECIAVHLPALEEKYMI